MNQFIFKRVIYILALIIVCLTCMQLLYHNNSVEECPPPPVTITCPTIPTINNKADPNLVFHPDQLDKKDLIETWRRTRVKSKHSQAKYGYIFEQSPWKSQDMVMLWDLFPPSYNCPLPVERIGRIGEGGKWICGMASIIKKPSCVVYSFGIGKTEVSFEQEILERTNCIVRMFDKGNDQTNELATNLTTKFFGRANIYKLRLGNPKRSRFPSFYALSLRTEMLKHGEKFIDILKVDIQGEEYFLVDQLVAEFKNHTFPFGQLQMKINVEKKVNLFESLMHLFGELEMAGLNPFHSEPNFYHQVQFGEISSIVSHEYSFINTKFLPKYLNLKY